LDWSFLLLLLLLLLSLPTHPKKFEHTCHAKKARLSKLLITRRKSLKEKETNLRNLPTKC
jgi:hypothetical protein